MTSLVSLFPVNGQTAIDYGWRPLILTKRYLTTVGRAVGSDFQVTSTVFSVSSAGTMLISFIFSDLASQKLIVLALPQSKSLETSSALWAASSRPARLWRAARGLQWLEGGASLWLSGERGIRFVEEQMAMVVGIETNPIVRSPGLARAPASELCAILAAPIG